MLGLGRARKQEFDFCLLQLEAPKYPSLTFSTHCVSSRPEHKNADNTRVLQRTFGAAKEEAKKDYFIAAWEGAEKDGELRVEKGRADLIVYSLDHGEIEEAMGCLIQTMVSLTEWHI